MSKQEIELMDEKFKGLTTLMNAQFNNVHEKLEKIEVQTTKTNGRVTELEKKSLSHIIECPQAPRIEAINNDLMEYKMAKKYPKAMIFLVIACVILMGVAMFNLKLNVSQEKMLEKPKTEIPK